MNVKSQDGKEKKCMIIKKKSNFHVNNLCWTWTLHSERVSSAKLSLSCVFTYNPIISLSFPITKELYINLSMDQNNLNHLPASAIECSYQCQWNTSWGHHKISLNEMKSRFQSCIQLCVMWVKHMVLIYIVIGKYSIIDNRESNIFPSNSFFLTIRTLLT